MNFWLNLLLADFVIGSLGIALTVYKMNPADEQDAAKNFKKSCLSFIVLQWLWPVMILVDFFSPKEK